MIKIEFNGFSEDITSFFSDLEDNNSKDWFNASKSRYETSVLNPMKQFIEIIGTKLQKVSKVTYDTRTNGQGSLMRINRDLRFSQDKTPYHIYLSALLWEGNGKKNQCPAFGFRIGKKGMELMTGIFMFSKEQLIQFRKAVISPKLGEELNNIIFQLSKLGYQIGGEKLKKNPKGFEETHPNAEWLRHKGFYVHLELIRPDILYSENIIDEVYSKFEAMAPFHQWLVKVLND